MNRLHQFGKRVLIFKKTHSSDSKSHYHRSIKEGEKVVGYSTSFLNLRWLLNDEIANVAFYLKKLSGTEHPLVAMAKNFILKTDALPWGLVVLLVAKTSGLKDRATIIDIDLTAGVLHSQRLLAEVAEMMRTSILLHSGVVSFPPDAENLDVLYYGNKISLLSGDYLLSKCFHDLATIRNGRVFHLIASALRDLSENAFIPPVDEKCTPFPTKPVSEENTNILLDEGVNLGPYNLEHILGHPKQEWVLRSLLTGTNLLGKSCMGAAILAGHGEDVQDNTYLFGKYLALSLQASLDCADFRERNSFSLIGAPVMLQLNEDHSLYEVIEKGLSVGGGCDYEKVRLAVEDGVGLRNAKQLQRYYASKALKVLAEFEESSARCALEKIVLAID